MASQPQGESDPLAELARLIGQTDPFSNFGRDQQAQPPRHVPRDHIQHDHLPHDQYAAPEPYEPEPYAPESYPQEHRTEEEDAPASRPSWVQNLTAGRQQREPSFREDDHFPPRYADDLPELADDKRVPHFDHSGYEPLPQEKAPAPAQPVASDRYDDILYGRSEQAPDHGYAQDAQGGAYDDGYDRPPYDDDLDHDAPKQRRGGTMTVVGRAVAGGCRHRRCVCVPDIRWLAAQR